MVILKIQMSDPGPFWPSCYYFLYLAAIVTILANDDARGFIYFEMDDLITLNEPMNGATGDTSVDLMISRGPGIYGVVNVPFEIVPELSENRNDLSPMQGIVSFQDRQVTQKDINPSIANSN